MSRKAKRQEANRQYNISRNPKFRPRTPEQSDAYRICGDNLVTILTGAAGTSKSYTAIAYAIDQLIKEDSPVEKIYLTRPAVEAGRSLGYLPGKATEKLAPFLQPLYDCMNDYVGEDNPRISTVRAATTVAPFNYMRGRTLKNAVAILDEAQNATLEEMKMFLTRIGEGCQMILCGDAEQSDIHHCSLTEQAERLHTVDGIEWFHFPRTANIRHPIIQEILECF